MTANTEQVNRIATGESLRFDSIQWLQKRSVNIIADAKMKRIVPCFSVRMLPLMFSIQESVPSSSEPMIAWAMNSMNIIQCPTANWVMTATQATKPMPTQAEMMTQVWDAKNLLSVMPPRMPPSESRKNRKSRMPTMLAPMIPTSFIIWPRESPLEEASDFGNFCPKNRNP